MGKRIASAAATLALFAAMTVGIAVANTSKGTDGSGGRRVHGVIPATGLVELRDFAGDGLTVGATLTPVSPLRAGSPSHRVGTAYAECIVAGKRLREGTPYDCTYVLELPGGTITTQGLDPRGVSDVFFA